MTKNQQTEIKYPEDILIEFPGKKYNRYLTTKNKKKYNRTYRIVNINDDTDLIFVKEIFLNGNNN